jgi:hypothetical protein
MRALTLGAVAVLLAGCAPSIAVETAIGPDTDLPAMRTFRVLATPAPRDDLLLDANDPMLVNSITNRELRRVIVMEFVGRGYRADDERPDFLVAFYATTRQTLDITYWNYGYRFHPRWWRGWGPRPMPVVTEFTEGTVIIDVLEPDTKELLWRGRGVALVSDDVTPYLKELRQTVHAILEEFPLAAAVVARYPACPMNQGATDAGANHASH